MTSGAPHARRPIGFTGADARNQQICGRSDIRVGPLIMVDHKRHTPGCLRIHERGQVTDVVAGHTDGFVAGGQTRDDRTLVGIDGWVNLDDRLAVISTHAVAGSKATDQHGG